MTAPDDSSVPTKVLFMGHTFSVFPFNRKRKINLVFHHLIDNLNYGSLFRKGIKVKVIASPKINMNVFKAI